MKGRGRSTRNQYKLNQGLKKEYEDMTGDDAGDQTTSKCWGYALQAHHCISCRILNTDKPEWGKLAVIGEYDINDTNGIALPAYCGHQKVNNEPRHSGHHWEDYYDRVKKLVKPIFERQDKKTLCKDKKAKERFKKDLQKAEEKIKENILGKKWWLYDWSEALYKHDYKDEGFDHLDLHSGNPRKASYTDGLEWAKRYGGKKVTKRRHRVQKGKEVVRKSWYEHYSYPVPEDVNR